MAASPTVSEAAALLESLVSNDESVQKIVDESSQAKELLKDDGVTFVRAIVETLRESGVSGIANMSIPESLGVNTGRGNDNRDSPLKPPKGEEEVSGTEFFKHLVETAFKFKTVSKEGNFDVLVEGPNKTSNCFRSRYHDTFEEMMVEFTKSGTAVNHITFSSLLPNVDNKNFPLPFYLSQVDALFGKFKGDETSLRKFLLSKHDPIEHDDFGCVWKDKYPDKESEEDADANADGKKFSKRLRLKPDLDFVDVSPEEAGDHFETEAFQADKRYAIVIAGESGSGKSIYSIGQAIEKGFLTVYCIMRSAEHKKSKMPIKLLDALKKKPASQYDELKLFLKLVIRCSEDQKRDISDLNRLYEFKGQLNTNRDKWASDVLNAAIEGLVEGDNNALNWFEGAWDFSRRPRKVAIIVDEATDIDLAEGLVATVRENTKKYLKTLAQEEVVIIVVGTGLDVFNIAGRVGTNPAYSRLITIKTPKIKIICKKNKISQEVYNALYLGLFPCILKSNTRMLFTAILPLLKLPIHQVDDGGDGKKRRLENRLIEVSSYRAIMDYAPRLYVTQNSVGNLSESSRKSLLRKSFIYHLVSSMKEIQWSNLNNHELELWKNEETGEEIFERGLASRYGTSVALKYLACFGLACGLRTSNGDDFEEMTALHFMRCMQVKGYETQRVYLRHAWPGQRTKGNLRDQIKELREKLERQEADEVFERPDTGGKYCIVFSQGRPTAQGGDVLVLIVNEKLAVLKSIQCKHYATFPGQAVVKTWWSSLGVLVNGNTVDMKPTGGSAGYSYVGLDSFRRFLVKKLDRPVDLGDRILAVSFKAVESFPMPTHRNMRVWFREMFEPTISVIPPKPGKRWSDDEEDGYETDGVD